MTSTSRNQQGLPLSIKLIGIFWMLKGIFLIVLAILVVLGANFLATFLKGHLPVQASVVILMLAIILAMLPIYIGRRILSRGKFAWYFVFISCMLLFFSSLLRHNAPSLPFVLIYGLSVWKLFEHRRLFGI